MPRLPLLRCYLLCVLLASNAFALPPEKPIALPAISAAPGSPLGVTSATNGRDFLFLWSDYRGEGSPVLTAARMSSAGEILDPLGIPIGKPGSPYTHHQVASDGENYLVAHSCAHSAVCLTRITPQGKISHLEPRSGASPYIAWNGSNYLLLIGSTGNGLPPTLQLLDRGGKDAGPAIALPDDGYWNSASSDGENFYVRFTTWGGKAFGFVVKADGAIDRSSQAVFPANSIASNGEGYLTTWTSGAGDSFTKFARPLTEAGQPGIPVQLPVFTQTDSLAAVGGNYVLVHQTATGIGFLKIGADGRPLALPRAITNDPTDIWPSIAANDRTIVVAWSRAFGPGGARQLMAQIFDHEGRAITLAGMLQAETIQISASVTRQDSASGAWGNGVTLVAWVERIGSEQTRTLFAGRLDPESTPLDGRGIRIAQSPHDQYSPVVSFDGASFLVVWSERMGNSIAIQAIRVSPDGASVDSVPILVQQFTAPYWRDPSQPIAVSWNGRTHTVAWIGASGLEAAGVSAAGMLVEPVRVVGMGGDRGLANPSIDWDGSHHLLVFNGAYSCTVNITCPADLLDVQALVLTPDLEVVERIVVEEERQYGSLASVAWNGSEHLIAWTGDFGVMARRYFEGALSAPLVVLRETGRKPFVGLDGERFVVAWTSAIYPGRAVEIRAARLEPGSKRFIPRILTSSPERETLSGMVSRPGALPLVLYDRSVEESPFDGVRRSFSLEIDFELQGRKRPASR